MDGFNQLNPSGPSRHGPQVTDASLQTKGVTPGPSFEFCAGHKSYVLSAGLVMVDGEWWSKMFHDGYGLVNDKMENAG